MACNSCQVCVSCFINLPTDSPAKSHTHYTTSSVMQHQILRSMPLTCKCKWHQLCQAVFWYWRVSYFPLQSPNSQKNWMDNYPVDKPPWYLRWFSVGFSRTRRPTLPPHNQCPYQRSNNAFCEGQPALVKRRPTPMAGVVPSNYQRGHVNWVRIYVRVLRAIGPCHLQLKFRYCTC